jgi:hypothetical protein
MSTQFCIFSKMIIPIQQKYNLDDPLQKLAHVTQLRPMSTPPHHKFNLSQFDNGNHVKLVISQVRVFYTWISCL